MLGENKLGRDSGEKYYKQKQQSTGEKVPSVLRLRNNRKAVGLECDELRGRVMGDEEREAGATGHRPARSLHFMLNVLKPGGECQDALYVSKRVENWEGHS